MIWTLAACRCTRCNTVPDATEIARIERDLATNPGSPPTRWMCMKCEPALALATSGLGWDVVEVVGCSPETT